MNNIVSYYWHSNDCNMSITIHHHTETLQHKWPYSLWCTLHPHGNLFCYWKLAPLDLCHLFLSVLMPEPLGQHCDTASLKPDHPFLNCAHLFYIGLVIPCALHCHIILEPIYQFLEKSILGFVLYFCLTINQIDNNCHVKTTSTTENKLYVKRPLFHSTWTCFKVNL